MKKFFYFLIVSLALIAFSCASSKKLKGQMIGLGHTFRDLRQHTFTKDKKTENSMVDISPDGETMAFVLDSSGNKDVYIKKLNSRAMTQKTFHKTDDAYPVFSPDGSKLAFASYRNGNWDIFIMNVSGGKAKRQITNSPEHEIAPSWSRDGKKLAFCRLSQSTGDWEIWTYDLQNGALTSLVPGKYPRYSPVEDKIAFQRSASSDKKKNWYAIWTIDDLGRQETIILSSDEKGFINPAWSKDGKKLAFSSGGDYEKSKIIQLGGIFKSAEIVVGERAGDIWTVNSDGTNLTQLTSHKEEDWGPAWGVDGRIYFTSARDKNTNIWSVIPDFVQLEDE